MPNIHARKRLKYSSVMHTLHARREHLARENEIDGARGRMMHVRVTSRDALTRCRRTSRRRRHGADVSAGSNTPLRLWSRISATRSRDRVARAKASLRENRSPPESLGANPYGRVTRRKREPATSRMRLNSIRKTRNKSRVRSRR